jgi:hypothetical protein
MCGSPKGSLVLVSEKAQTMGSHGKREQREESED